MLTKANIHLPPRLLDPDQLKQTQTQLPCRCTITILPFQGCVETVRKLLAEGADPNTKDHAGWTPLVSDS